MKKLISNKKIKVTITEMALASIFVAIIISSKLPFFQINLGIMRVGTEYIWLILVGLIFKPFLGLTTAILGDTFGMLANGQIGQWHYIYFFIPIIIYLLTFLLKNIYKVHSQLKLSIIGASISLLISIILAVMFIVERSFIKYGNSSTAIDFTKTATQILVWTMFAVSVIGSITLLAIYHRKQNAFWKNIYVTYLITSIVIVVAIWIFGPLANILWLTDIGGKFRGTNHYWKLYNTYQIPRLIKTPIILPIYVFIITPVYTILSKKVLHDYKW